MKGEHSVSQAAARELQPENSLRLCQLIIININMVVVVVVVIVRPGHTGAGSLAK